MSERWVIQMDPGDALSAAALRTVPGLRICLTEAGLWITGDACDEVLDRRLRMLPARRRFTVDAGNRLIPSGGLVPAGEIPAGPWEPLHAWFEPRVQVACLPGQLASRVRLRLVRTDCVTDAALLVTTLSDWCAFAVAAPQVRLDRLRCAVSDTGRVAVHGRPLPPIAGRRYVEEDGVAVPCGFSVDPPVGSAVLRRLLGLGADDLALLDSDGTCELIPADGFVMATRSAARLSRRRLEHG